MIESINEATKMKQQQQHTHHQQYSRISKIEVNGTAVQKKSGDACRVFYRFLVGYFFSLLLYLLSEYLLLASLSLQILFLFIYLSCVCVCVFFRTGILVFANLSGDTTRMPLSLCFVVVV